MEEILRIQELMSEADFVNLTGHTNNVIRTYAFWALIRKNSDLLIPTLKLYENDTSIVNYYQGCIFYKTSLIYLVAYLADKQKSLSLSVKSKRYIKQIINSYENKSVQKLS